MPLPVLVLCISIFTPRSSKALTCSTGPFHADKWRADLPDGVVLLRAVIRSISVYGAVQCRTVQCGSMLYAYHFLAIFFHALYNPTFSTNFSSALLL